MWLKCMCDDTGGVPSVAVTTRIKYGAKFSLHLLTILVEERFGGYSVVDIFSDKDCTINITLFMNNVCFCSSCIKSSLNLGVITVICLCYIMLIRRYFVLWIFY